MNTSLSASPWRLRVGKGEVLVPDLELAPDGSLRASSGLGVSSDPRVRDALDLCRWAWVDDTLAFYGANGQAVIRFDTQEAYHVGRRFGGQVRLGFAAPSPVWLEPTADPTGHPLNYLQVTSSLGHSKPALVIVFNSAGRPFDTHTTHWEFYGLPAELGLDAIRVSETAPASWYLTHTRAILAQVLAVIDQGYTQVFLTGMSSGGYASLWFAEQLAQLRPHIMARSVVINPQTTHRPEHREHVLREFIEPFRPIIMQDTTYAQRDHDETHLPALLERPLSNCQHTVFFDDSNPAEVYYADLIAPFDRVLLKPQTLNQDHFHGCFNFYHQDVVQQTIRQALGRAR